MPITFSVDQRRRRIRTKAHGTVTPADVAQFFSDRVSAGVEDFDQIVDISGARLMVQEADLRPLANDRNAALAGLTAGRTAWIAPTDEQFARAQALKAKLETLGVTVAVFRSSADAEAWLDQAPSTLT